ncbi:hypothetical protein AAG570_001013 [Ranatra chinensis]|uniref:Uncharacterized protein n=1 Tax=Ranatra chinensis TaxID=642074 RepID=A0ABD0YCH6_9HEMI
MSKSPEPNEIPYEFYTALPKSFRELILSLFNVTNDEQSVPAAFKKSLILPLYKKGDSLDPTDYRGISFSNTIYKLLTGIILNGSTNWIELHDILKENQTGVRRGYSTVDHLFNLTNIIKLRLQNKRKKILRLICRFCLCLRCNKPRLR